MSSWGGQTNPFAPSGGANLATVPVSTQSYAGGTQTLPASAIGQYVFITATAATTVNLPTTPTPANGAFIAVKALGAGTTTMGPGSLPNPSSGLTISYVYRTATAAWEAL